jgi:hypothetical protein
VPAWRSASFGLANPSQPFPATYDSHGDPGVYQDDERDADADGLSNWIESVRGPGHYTWWAGFWKQEALQVEPWKKKSYCGQRPGDFDQRPFADVDLADPDVDGDTLLDGEDDQDNDDVINIAELYEIAYDLDGDGGFTCGAITYPSMDMDPGAGVDPWGINAFNPCAPNPSSRTCADWKPFG